MTTLETVRDIKWTIDPAHSEIAFKVRHLMIAHVKGLFKTFDASIHTSGKDFTTSEIDLWIDTASISTGDEKRDEHLKSAEFFDAKNYKEITFVSNTMGGATPKGNHELWGDLTIKGITKNIKLTVQFGGIQKDPWGNEKAGFTVNGKINRSDWGLTWNTAIESGGVMVGDEINITCEIELTNEGQPVAAIEPESVPEKNSTIE